MRRSSRRPSAACGRAAAAGRHETGAEPNTGRADRVFVNGRIWTGEPGKPPARGARRARRDAARDRHERRGPHARRQGHRRRRPARPLRRAPASSTRTCTCSGGGWSLEELRLDDASDLAALAGARARVGAGEPRGALGHRRGLELRRVPGRPAHAARSSTPLVADRPALPRLLRRPHRLGQLGRAAARRGHARQTRTRRAARSCATPRASPRARSRSRRNGSSSGWCRSGCRTRTSARCGSGIAQAAAWGLTGVHQAGIGEEELESLARALEASPQLRVYVGAAHRARPHARGARAAGRSCASAIRGAAAARSGAVKGFVDGVVESRTAAMFEPYAGRRHRQRRTGRRRSSTAPSRPTTRPAGR